MPGAAMPNAPPRETDGDASVAHEVLERMQASGARDRVKEWLFEALDAAGWTAALAARAADVKGEPAGEPASVQGIVEAVEGFGFGKLSRPSSAPRLHCAGCG